MNYRLIGPMQREIARLNFEGKLQAVAEQKDRIAHTLRSELGTRQYRMERPATIAPWGIPQPTGRALVAQLKDNQFLVAGYFCRVDFRPAAAEQHRQFLRVEEGTYENGVFKFQRIWNGDETDWGLNFGAEPLVLRVSLATY